MNETENADAKGRLAAAGSAAGAPIINVFRIHRPGHAQYYSVDAEAVTAEAEAMLDSMDPDDEIRISVRRMERAEYEALPEFEGW